MCKTPAQVRPFAKTNFLFPARRKIPLCGILVGLEGTTVVHFAFRQSSATFFPSQNRFALLIHPFPPENLLTVNFRLSPTPVHARRRRNEIGSLLRRQILRRKDNQNGHIIFYLCGLSTTCREAAHIEQSERSGTLHIEWAKAHISSAASRHISTKTYRRNNKSIFPLSQSGRAFLAAMPPGRTERCLWHPFRH